MSDTYRIKARLDGDYTCYFLEKKCRFLFWNFWCVIKVEDELYRAEHIKSELESANP